MNTHFINVDLEIQSHESLQPIADAFGDDVAVLHCGNWGSHYDAAFESANAGGEPDSIIRFFCQLVLVLKQSEREMWGRA